MGRYLDIVRKLEEALRAAKSEQFRQEGEGQTQPCLADQFTKLLEHGDRPVSYLATNTGASEATCRVVLGRHAKLFYNVGGRDLGLWRSTKGRTLPTAKPEEEREENTMPNWTPVLNGVKAVERAKELEPARLLAEEYWAKGGDKLDTVLCADLGVADSTLRHWHVLWRIRRGPHKEGNVLVCVCGHRTSNVHSKSGHARGCLPWQSYARSLLDEAKVQASSHKGTYTRWCDSVGVSASWFGDRGVHVNPNHVPRHPGDGYMVQALKELGARVVPTPAPAPAPEIDPFGPVVARKLPVIITTKNDETHPLIKALLGSMPRQGSVWPRAERAKWLNILDAILGTVYSE